MTLQETVLNRLEAHLARCSESDLEKILAFLDASKEKPGLPTDGSGFGDRAFIRVNRTGE